MATIYEQFRINYSLYPSNNAIIYHKTEEEVQRFTYSKIYHLCSLICTWLKSYVTPNTCIGVLLSQDPLLVPIILGIHKMGCAFLCLNETTPLESINSISKSVRMRMFMSLEAHMPNGVIEIARLNIENSTLMLWTPSNASFALVNYLDKNIAYVIKTSGSTGDSKLVWVTHNSINPNIKELSEKFEITSQDIIYLGTPTTFDPFIIEFYLTFSNGACSLIVSKNIKYSNKIIQILFEKTPITILQTTPSLFRMLYGDSASKCVLSKNTRLRILALGGEACPTLQVLKQWRHKENDTRIFYLYGITEISCWAMIREVEINDLREDKDEIYLGESMLETVVELRDENGKFTESTTGELYIGSKTRICIMEKETDANILSSNNYIFRQTGDLVMLKNQKIYYLSRTTECIKRLGSKVNICSIESKVNNFEGVEKTICVWISESHQLILFYKTHKKVSQNKIWKLIQTHLSEIEYPDFIHSLETFPLSKHGKICKHELKAIHESIINRSDLHINIEKQFLQELENILPCIIGDQSFLQLGGSSIKALALVSKVELIMNMCFKNLMYMLLDEKTSIEECIKYIHNEISCQKNSTKDMKTDRNKSNSLGIKMDILWAHNLNKCIDASPTLHRNFVAVGSHSHKLVTLNKESGEVISCLMLPDRIESSVTYISDTCAVVGCYDGTLYCFNYRDGEIKWQFKTDDMIKGTAVYVAEMDMLVFPSYDKHLYCINSVDGRLNWSRKLCNKPLLATPCISKIHSNIFSCSLGGTCACLDILTSNMKWSKKYDYPIFSNPVIIYENSDHVHYLFAEVNGALHCLNENGLEIWSYSATGSIYSSFHVRAIDVDSLLIIFGCHDKLIYCLKIKNIVHNPKPILKWNCELKSQVYSTPSVISLQNKEYVIAASTVGNVSLVEIDTGIIISDLQIMGEVYSSPAVSNNTIYLGCRDNNLYCIKVI